jgi:hypothetical protein
MGGTDGERRVMASRILRNAEDVDGFVKLLCTLKLPLTLSWVQGADRSTEQNALMWMWATEVAAQLGDRTVSRQQAEWKLTIGVPILRGDDPDFRAKYDKSLRWLPYETKLDIMEAFFPVTSLMKVRQMCRFLDGVERQCLGMGLSLTQPSDDLASYNRRYGKAA